MPISKKSKTNQLPDLISAPHGLTLNDSAHSLANLAAWHHQTITRLGLLTADQDTQSTQPAGGESNPIVASHRPWIDEPPGSVPFDEQGVFTLPASNSTTDHPVLTVTVPQGFDGVINYISNNTTAAGFPEGSGELIWKILINGRPVRNFGNILVSKGTPAQGRIVSPIRVFSGDVIAYTVENPTGALAGQVICSLNGYFYPSRGIS